MGAARKIEIDTAVQEQIGETRQVLSVVQSKATEGKTFYQNVLDHFADGTRNTPEQLPYLNALETAISVFRSSARTIRSEMDLGTLESRLRALGQNVDPAAVTENEGAEGDYVRRADALNADIVEATLFSNRYALFYAGMIGLSLLEEQQDENVKSKFNFGALDAVKEDPKELPHTSNLAEATTYKLLKLIAEKEKAGEKITNETLKGSLRAQFTTWVQQFNWNSFSDIASKLGADEFELAYQKFTAKAGEFKRGYSTVKIDDRFMRITVEDCIGAEGYYDPDVPEPKEPKLGTVLDQNFSILSAFNYERGDNPHDLTHSIFTFGDPGCGKTFISHAYIRSFAEEMQEMGLPVWAFTHSVTDYSSTYQNATAIALNKLIMEIREFPGPVIMYIADADTVFQSRNRPGITAEQEQVIGTYLKMFDGTLIPRNGKFLAVMDANYIENIDKATQSRVMGEIVRMRRFDDPQDFADLSQLLVTKKGKYDVPITPEQWYGIGELALDTGLSNRQIMSALSTVARYKIPRELRGAPYEKHLEFRKTQMESITYERVQDRLKMQVLKAAEVAEASQAARRRGEVESNVEKFRKMLSTQYTGGAPGPQAPQ